MIYESIIIQYICQLLWQAKSDYLLVFLAKHNAGSDWSHITHAEKAAADAKKKSDDASKLGDKDDPSAGLMNVSLYDIQ